MNSGILFLTNRTPPPPPPPTHTQGYVSAFPVRLVLFLTSDLSLEESYQMSALAERMAADDSVVSENDKSGLAR
jgi:hypothetical protein